MNPFSVIRKVLPMLLLSLFIIVSLVTIGCSNDPGDDLELPGVTINDLSVLEGNKDNIIVIDIRLSSPSAEEVIVFLSSVDSTALSGEDFKNLDVVPVVFEPADLRESIQITIFGDEVFEEDEVFILKLHDPVGAELVEPTAIITIENDDIDTSLKIPETGYSTPETYDGMTLTWQDEFNGTSMNDNFWTHETRGDWFNNELQYTLPDNTYLKDGNMIIEARKESHLGHAYTSSRWITKGKYEFQYGRVDIRATLPFGQGIWPALWMLGVDHGWPASGEIDIMEMIGGSNRENTVHGTIHWQDPNGNPNNNFHAEHGGPYTLPTGTFNDEYHVFSIVWDDSKIEWYVDDNKYFTADITNQNLSEFHQSYFFIFNIAVGGNWPGNPDNSTVFPQRMIIDYIRVFQPN